MIIYCSVSDTRDAGRELRKVGRSVVSGVNRRAFSAGMHMKFLLTERENRAISTSALYPRGKGLSSTGGWFLTTVFVFMLIFNGCAALSSSFTSSISSKMAGNLSRAFVNYDDLATVETAVPAYLLMVESFLEQDPKNESLLLTASKLYNSYTAAFVKEPERAARLSRKALGFAFRAMCNRHPDGCDLKDMPFERFQSFMSRTTQEDLPALYALGAAWASDVQAHQTDWNAVALLPRIESVMKRVLVLDETFESGGAHLYMAVFSTLVPPALGGRPEEGRKHFERALQISGRKNLMVHVFYAKHYARMVFDRELHDGLLKEVLAADPKVDGFVLINMAAQAEAKGLLASAEAYF